MRPDVGLVPKAEDVFWPGLKSLGRFFQGSAHLTKRVISSLSVGSRYDLFFGDHMGLGCEIEVEGGKAYKSRLTNSNIDNEASPSMARSIYPPSYRRALFSTRHS
jgi:hypothetical protein